MPQFVPQYILNVSESIVELAHTTVRDWLKIALHYSHITVVEKYLFKNWITVSYASYAMRSRRTTLARNKPPRGLIRFLLVVIALAIEWIM